jgi:hypothetical protein
MQARFVESDSVNLGLCSAGSRSRRRAPFGKKVRPGAPLSPGLTMNDAPLREPVHTRARRLQTCYKRCSSGWLVASMLL